MVSYDKIFDSKFDIYYAFAVVDEDAVVVIVVNNLFERRHMI